MKPAIIQASFRLPCQARLLQAKTSGLSTYDGPGLRAFSVNLKASTGGSPFPESLTREMESAFGTVFSDVRVHVGDEAPRIGAVAFTRGSHLHFAPGQYNPTTYQGRRLIAHELAHVVQQRAGRVRCPLGGDAVVVEDAALEADAERWATRATMASTVQRTASALPVASAPPPNFVQRTRAQRLQRLVVSLPPHLQRWLAALQQQLRLDPDNMSDVSWRRLLAFVKGLRAFPNLQLPNVDSETEVGQFVYGILTAARALGRLPIGFSTGIQMTVIDPDSYDDSLLTVKGVRAYAPALISSRHTPRVRYLPGHHNTARVHIPSLLSRFGSDLDSPNRDLRLRAQAVIRGSDKEYRGTQGLVYSPFISTNRDAIRRLAMNTQGADMIVSLERGGSYVADQIEAMLTALDRPRVPHLRIRKPSASELAIIHGAFQSSYDSYASNIKEFDKKTSHVLMLVRAIEDQLLQSPAEPLNVVVTETVVGGGSTNGLLKGLAYLAHRYRNLRIRLLLHRHTSHQSQPHNARFSDDIDLANPQGDIVLDPSGGQKLRLSNLCSKVAEEIQVILARLREHIPKTRTLELARRRHSEWPERHVGVHIASGFYVLGEDIDAFLSGRRTITDGQGHPRQVAAQVPIIIFRNNQGIIIRPGCMMNSRQLLQMIVSGAFDSLLQSFGISIEQQPNQQGMPSAQRRGF